MIEITGRLSTALADRYQLERHIGEGGMATVYLAKDLRHKRKVAVKVLRPELAAVLGAERFLQEITTTANLQHPHILPLFDSGEADSFLYYVMPFIDGETLRAKLNRETQLGIDEAVSITTAIADALDYAHRHNVIHRDIKPENILLHDGRPMVADFGIALAVSAAAGGRMTETGMSLGTPHYMSPEQATAEKELTNRSDIYSLGSVLYEMLTGQPPHMGNSAQQIIMKIVTDEARPVTELRKSVPPHVAAATAKSLEKLPADRFDTSASFAEALVNPSFTAPASLPTTASTARPGAEVWKGRFYGAVTVIAALLATTLIGWLRPGPSPPVSRQRVVLWDEWEPLSGNMPAYDGKVAVAPDGSSVVFWDSTEAGIQLMRKLRDETEPIPLAGTQGGVSPFFSPDGVWIGFVTRDGELRKVPSGGGGSLLLAENVNTTFRVAAWMDDEYIVYIDNAWDVNRVPAGGGTSEILVALESTRGMIPASLWPLPGSKGFLFTGCPGNCAQSGAYVYDIQSDSMQLLFEDALGVWYAPTGHVLYTDRDGGLYAAAFDADALEVQGGAVPVLDGVGPGQFILSASGVVLYEVGGSRTTDRELVWVTRKGAFESIDPDWRGEFDYPALSPDGSQLAVSLSEGETHLWIKQLGGGEQKLRFEGAVNWRPAWTPDGQAVAFVSNRGGTSNDNNLYVRRADGSTTTELILALDAGLWEVEYSQDGQWMVVRTDDPGSNSNIYAIRLDGDSVLVPVVIRESLERTVALSPDGRWLAYASDESGRFEVYVVPFPDADSRRLVSHDGGEEPRWAHSGRELFFKSAGMLMAVDVLPGSPPTFGEPRPLFSVNGYLGAQNRQQYDVAPDDDRFVMIRILDREEPGALVYAENWFEELKAKVGRE